MNDDALSGGVFLSGGGTFINNTLIRGSGNIGGNNTGIVNNSIIRADVSPTLALFIDPLNVGSTLPGMVNNGTLLANGGPLQLSGNGGGFIDNAAGRIVAGSTDVQLITGIDIRNGTFTSSGAGVVRVLGGNAATLTNVTNTGNIVVDPNASLNVAGTLTNNASINLDATTLSSTLSPAGAVVTLAGSGVINMNDDAQSGGVFLSGGGTFIINTLIRGSGNIGGNNTAATNNATIEASAGSLSLFLDPVNLGGTTPGMTNNGTLLASTGHLILSGNGGGFYRGGTLSANTGGTLTADGLADVRLVTIRNNGVTNVNSNSAVTAVSVRGIGTVNISNNSTLTIIAGAGTNSTSTMRGLTTTAGGRLDLTDSAVLIDYTGASPRSAIAALVASGFGGGTWNGATGIISSLAAGSPPSLRTGVGYAEASFAAPGGVFQGQPHDGTAVAVRYTLLGDSNLSGSVDIGDFAILVANFNLPANWDGGDYNYSGVTDIGDFALLVGNFNKALPAPVAGLGAVVPEPSMGLAILAGIAGLAGRRRR
jgi:hypothetical protein